MADVTEERQWEDREDGMKTLQNGHAQWLLMIQREVQKTDIASLLGRRHYRVRQ